MAQRVQGRAAVAARTRSTEPRPVAAKLGLPALSLAALGVVFGDIGTSPLYAFKQCFSAGRGFAPTPENVLGILSLVTWALILVVCVKYCAVVLRADYDGEGGTLALLAQLRPSTKIGIPGKLTKIAMLLLFGSAMLYGDGIITPAISVLSAVEGIGVATSAAAPYEVPLTIAILIALFLVQSRGTGQIGAVFGPVMLLWFAALAAGGVAALAHAPGVLAAVNPVHALAFMHAHGPAGVLVLGAVVLVVTGVETLYADLAHFGRRAIWLAWYAITFPALLLNYYGQAALVLGHPNALDNPFYALYPASALVPMVVLATVATVIASQAVISGAFSLTQQAVQLGYLPRLKVIHTSHAREGQIYLPFVNVLLALGCVALVLVFRSSDRLGTAYGLAVTVTMLCTTIGLGALLPKRFGWGDDATALFVAAFVAIDGGFLVGNMVKLADGAWLPAAVALTIFGVYTTWVAGRRRLATAMDALSTPVDAFVAETRKLPPSRTEGTAVFLTPLSDGIPFLMRHHWLKTRALREQIVLMTIVNERRPYVEHDRRVEVERVAPTLVRIVAHYGFMETPSVAEIAERARRRLPPEVDLAEADYFLARPRLERVRGRDALPAWRRWLLGVMTRNAAPLTDSLGIPPDRIVEFSIPLRV
ncbi:MAG TPA: KUP/HAK/KT family potassium transporter [Candidatus Elarobacter sp.]|nr:KUP/HAK/KT family potassium transporter [Candidatus Elarobacter sp.]